VFTRLTLDCIFLYDFLRCWTICQGFRKKMLSISFLSQDIVILGSMSFEMECLTEINQMIRNLDLI